MFPRRISGCAADGRDRELLTASTSVSAVMTAGTVAEAYASEEGEQVVEFLGR